MFRTKSWVIAMAVALSACGGGGDDPPPAGPTLEDGAISGSATKGIVRHGVVELYQVAADGTGKLIGTGTTDEQGRYAADYTDFVVDGGPVRVLVRSKTAAEAESDPPGTSMTCDVSDAGGCGPSNGAAADVNEDGIINAGELIELPAHDPEGTTNFGLNTVLPAPPAEGVVAPVTPFTELVYRRALERAADPALSASFEEAVLESASEISQLVGGLDVLRLEPVDLSNAESLAAASADQLAYSALVAAVLAQQIEAGGEGSDALLASISGLVAATEGGDILAADLQSLLVEAQEEFTALNVVDESGLFEVIQETIDSAGEGGTVNPEPQAGAGDERVQRAKNLIQNVRDTINGLTALEAPAQTFQTQVELAKALLDEGDHYTDPETGESYDSLGLMVAETAWILEVAQACVDEFLQETGDGADGHCEFHNSTDTEPPVEQVFTTDVSQTAGQLTVLVAGEAEGRVVDLSADFPADADQDTRQTLTVGLSGTIETNPNWAPGTGLKLTFAGATVTLVKTGPVPLEDSDPNTDDSLNMSSVSFDLGDVMLEQIRTPESQEGGPVRFVGSIGATAVRCTAASCVAREEPEGQATFVPSAFELDGDFSNDLNSVALSVSAQVANAASFDPDLENESGDTVTPGNFPDATVTLTFDAALGAAAPARVVLSGSLDGIFEQPDNCEGCSEGATYSDPDATVTLTLMRNGVQVFRAQSETIDVGDVTDVSTTITDSTGAALVVYMADDAIDEAQTTLRVDGVDVGGLEETSSGLVIVRYTDGTFESLF